MTNDCGGRCNNKKKKRMCRKMWQRLMEEKKTKSRAETRDDRWRRSKWEAKQQNRMQKGGIEETEVRSRTKMSAGKMVLGQESDKTLD